MGKTVENPFQGSLVALVTPMKDGTVDTKALAALVQWHLSEGTDGLVPCGTTGESATLTSEEKATVFRTVLAEAKGKAPVLAGTGTNKTADSIEATRAAQEMGADGALVITPYYNKPTQEGLFQHFKAVHDASSIPLVLYNVPGRTGTNMTAETAIRCGTELERVVAVKEASGDLVQAAEIVRQAGDAIHVLSGEDTLTLPLISIGAKGVVGVTQNVAPKDVRAMVQAALGGDFAKAREIHLRLLPLMRALFLETNPIPVKTAVEWMGKCGPERRMPLTTLSEAPAKRLRAVMTELGYL